MCSFGQDGAMGGRKDSQAGNAKTVTLSTIQEVYSHLGLDWVLHEYMGATCVPKVSSLATERIPKK